jgi:hypothetical protein
LKNGVESAAAIAEKGSGTVKKDVHDRELIGVLGGVVEMYMFLLPN